MKIKRILLFVAIAAIILAVAAVVAVGVFLDKGVKRGVETFGPKLTKTPVKLEDVSLSLLSGSGTIKGFELGNPEGFKSPNAIKVGTATLGVKPRSLLSDKVVVNTVNVQAPEITFETDLRGNNLSQILANLEEATGGPTETTPEETEPAASRKLQVNEFVITGGKIHVSLTALGGKGATVPLPEIRLNDLGTGPEGITAAELTKRVLKIVLNESIKSASATATDLAKGVAADVTGQAQNVATQAAGTLNKTLGGLLKKKKSE